jgi:hypothetical protein
MGTEKLQTIDPSLGESRLGDVLQRMGARARALPIRGARLTALIVTGLFALVLLRAWVFIAYPHAHLDSDQAVFGLMGKDIELGRAYPLFMYGQKYMLSVGSWLCAPLFALFGRSTTTLKLPMFAMNIACVAMLWVGLRRERELGRWGTALCILPFAAPSVVCASRFVEHQGGNIEPFFFLFLAFLLRERGIALGLTLGIAFLNREFTPLGFIALVAMDALQGRLRRNVKIYVSALVAAALVVVSIRAIAEGREGYTGAGGAAHAEWQDVWSGEGSAAYFGLQLPALLGAARNELRSYSIVSGLHAGKDWLIYIVVGWAMLGVLGIARAQRRDFDGMSSYLILIGLGQAAAFIALCNSPRDTMLVRYMLLSLCCFVGFTAFAWRMRQLRPIAAALVLTLCTFNLRDHVRLIREYVQKHPRHENELLADALLARGVPYATADFWVAYDIDWLTDERIIISPGRNQSDRIERYHEPLDAHPSEVYRIKTKPCRGGEQIERWYLCPPKR